MEKENILWKIVEEKVNMLHLICGEEKSSALWYPPTENYSNEVKKWNAWNDNLHFIPDSDGKSLTDKTKITRLVTANIRRIIQFMVQTLKLAGTISSVYNLSTNVNLTKKSRILKD